MKKSTDQLATLTASPGRTPPEFGSNPSLKNSPNLAVFLNKMHAKRANGIKTKLDESSFSGDILPMGFSQLRNPKLLSQQGRRPKKKKKQTSPCKGDDLEQIANRAEQRPQTSNYAPAASQDVAWNQGSIDISIIFPEFSKKVKNSEDTATGFQSELGSRKPRIKTGQSAQSRFKALHSVLQPKQSTAVENRSVQESQQSKFRATVNTRMAAFSPLFTSQEGRIENNLSSIDPKSKMSILKKFNFNQLSDLAGIAELKMEQLPEEPEENKAHNLKIAADEPRISFAKLVFLNSQLNTHKLGKKSDAKTRPDSPNYSIEFSAENSVTFDSMKSSVEGIKVKNFLMRSADFEEDSKATTIATKKMRLSQAGTIAQQLEPLIQQNKRKNQPMLRLRQVGKAGLIKSKPPSKLNQSTMLNRSVTFADHPSLRQHSRRIPFSDNESFGVECSTRNFSESKPIEVTDFLSPREKSRGRNPHLAVQTRNLKSVLYKDPLALSQESANHSSVMSERQLEQQNSTRKLSIHLARRRLNAHAVAKQIWQKRLKEHITCMPIEEWLQDQPMPTKKPQRSSHSPVAYRRPPPQMYERKERSPLPSANESPLLRPSKDSSSGTDAKAKELQTQELARFQLKMMKNHMLMMTQARIEEAKELSPEQKEKARRRAIKDLIAELEMARVLRKSTKQRFQTTSSRLMEYLKNIKSFD